MTKTTNNGENWGPEKADVLDHFILELNVEVSMEFLFLISNLKTTFLSLYRELLTKKCVLNFHNFYSVFRVKALKVTFPALLCD